MREAVPYLVEVLYNLTRRGARADEWNGLENRRGVTASAGSNPAPSAPVPVGTEIANHYVEQKVHHEFLGYAIRQQGLPLWPRPEPFSYRTK